MHAIIGLEKLRRLRESHGLVMTVIFETFLDIIVAPSQKLLFSMAATQKISLKEMKYIFKNSMIKNLIYSCLDRFLPLFCIIYVEK